MPSLSENNDEVTANLRELAGYEKLGVTCKAWLS
jgi:hypothetical protein